MSDAIVASELKALLQKNVRGVKDVTIEYGIVSVKVSSKRAAHNVKIDMLRTGAFSSVVITEGLEIAVQAVPK